MKTMSRVDLVDEEVAKTIRGLHISVFFDEKIRFPKKPYKDVLSDAEYEEIEETIRAEVIRLKNEMLPRFHPTFKSLAKESQNGKGRELLVVRSVYADKYRAAISAAVLVDRLDPFLEKLIEEVNAKAIYGCKMEYTATHGMEIKIEIRREKEKGG